MARLKEILVKLSWRSFKDRDANLSEKKSSTLLNSKTTKEAGCGEMKLKLAHPLLFFYFHASPPPPPPLLPLLQQLVDGGGGNEGEHPTELNILQFAVGGPRNGKEKGREKSAKKWWESLSSYAKKKKI